MAGDQKIIIRAVLPKWVVAVVVTEDVVIVSAVTNSLRLSESCNATTVSLPFISHIDKNLPIDVLPKACLMAYTKLARNLVVLKNCASFYLLT